MEDLQLEEKHQYDTDQTTLEKLRIFTLSFIALVYNIHRTYVILVIFKSREQVGNITYLSNPFSHQSTENTVLGSILAFADTVESEGREMKHCLIKNLKVVSKNNI
jgi:hypothetical protein